MKLFITLPGGTQATASITEVSDELTRRLEAQADAEDSGDEVDEVSLLSLFQVGQMVRCIVLKKTSKTDPKTKAIKRIVEVSLKPNLINKDRLKFLKAGSHICGAVAAEEDYGFVIQLGGPKDKKGFLKRSPGQDLAIGQLVECFVEASYTPKGSAAVPVTLEGLDSHITPSGDMNSHSLVAGMLTQAKVINVVDSGLIVRLFDFFNGTVHLTQINLDKQSLSSRFEKGSSILVRLVRVDYETKVISLSVKPHLIAMKPFRFPVKIGDKFAKSAILLARDEIGLSLQLNSNPPQEAFVHVSTLLTTAVGVSHSECALGERGSRRKSSKEALCGVQTGPESSLPSHKP
jgi:rRNA biogenesis protein RRP5